MIKINLNDIDSKGYNYIGALVLSNIDDLTTGIVVSDYDDATKLNVMMLSDDGMYNLYYPHKKSLSELLEDFDVIRFKDEYSLNIDEVILEED